MVNDFEKFKQHDEEQCTRINEELMHRDAGAGDCPDNAAAGTVTVLQNLFYCVKLFSTTISNLN